MLIKSKKEKWTKIAEKFVNQYGLVNGFMQLEKVYKLEPNDVEALRKVKTKA